MRGHLRLVGSALVLSLAVTACASLPTSGIVQNTSLQGSGAQAQPGVQVVPVPPGRNWGQIDIVMGFLAASASFDDDYAVARKYLTTGLSRWWHPGVAATVIDSPNPSEEQPPRGLVTSGPPAGRVSVTGRHFAELQTGGPHQAGSIVASPGSSTYHFSLIEKAGVWRIDGISVGSKPARPSLLVLTSTDFERDYQARNLYFFRPGPAANTLVPDPVYIPQLPGDGGLKILVNTLLPSKRAAGSPWPPSSSWLYQAATTAFPRGTKLISVNIIGGAEAVVKLGGTAVRTSPSQRMRMDGPALVVADRVPLRHPEREPDPVGRAGDQSPFAGTDRGRVQEMGAARRGRAAVLPASRQPGRASGGDLAGRLVSAGPGFAAGCATEVRRSLRWRCQRRRRDSRSWLAARARTSTSCPSRARARS